MSRDAVSFPSPLGRLELARAALVALVVHAAEEVDGAVVRRRGVEVDVADGRVTASVAIDAPLGTVLPELAGEVQRRVAEAVGRALGLAATVDVVVEGLT